MQVLHLTDLHLTAPNTNLNTLWAGIDRKLPSKLDFVVISGDLTQDASPEKYRSLHDFLVDHVLPRVPRHDPARVILVPGNHDVDWGADIIDPEATISDVAVERYLKDPETQFGGDSQIRVQVGPNVVTRVAIARSRYHRRFANCQEFLKNFYSTLPSPHRTFVLNDVDPGQHWSAHVFLEEGIAFAGLSSCVVNDKYWRGAALSGDAIAAAGRYLDQNAPRCLRVAVWHHGLTSMRGFPDHVSLRELGQIINQDFHIGIHGHTHEDEINSLLPLFGERSIPIIATGSFGAGASERPGGLRNQVSLMEITHAFVRRQLFQGDDRGLQWTESKPVTIPLKSRHIVATAPADLSFAGKHERSVFVDHQGVTSVRVTMQDVEIDGELDLAAPGEAWGTVVPDPCARVWDGSAQSTLAVDRSRDGARFCITSAQPLRYDKLEWGYTLTNVFALDAGEVGMLPSGGPEGPLYEGEHDVWLHQVRVCSRELSLLLKLPSGCLKDAGGGRVQYRDGTGTWLNVSPDSAISVEKPSADQVLLRVQHPRLRYRYGVAYSLASHRQQLEPDISALLDQVAVDCRNSPLGTEGLSQALTAAITRAARVLPNQIPVIWIAHLWHSGWQVLVPVFGNFPARSWGSRFRYGEGVAGHAFRFRGPAVFYKDASTTSSFALYRKSTTAPESVDHLWVISLPLLVLPGGAAIGTIGFADYGQSDVQFKQFARELTAQVHPARTKNFDKIDRIFTNLSHMASFAFWSTLEERGGTDLTKQIATEIRAKWEGAGG